MITLYDVKLSVFITGYVTRLKCDGLMFALNESLFFSFLHINIVKLKIGELILLNKQQLTTTIGLQIPNLRHMHMVCVIVKHVCGRSILSNKEQGSDRTK